MLNPQPFRKFMVIQSTGGASGGMNMRAFEHGIKAEELAGPIRNSTGTSSLSWTSQSGSSHTVECDNSVEFSSC